jgi:hypothetical protein
MRSRSAPVVTYGFTTFYEEDGYWDDWSGQQRKALFAQFGGYTPGEIVFLSVPTGQITDVQRVDYDGMAGQRVEVQGQLDADTTGTTDLAKSAFRIHKL